MKGKCTILGVLFIVSSIFLYGCRETKDKISESTPEQEKVQIEISTPEATPTAMVQQNSDFPEERIGYFSNGYWGIDIKQIDNTSKTITYDGYEYAASVDSPACMDGKGTIVDGKTLQFGETVVIWSGDSFELTGTYDCSFMSSGTSQYHDYEHGAGVYKRSEKPQTETSSNSTMSVEGDPSEYILPDSSSRLIFIEDFGDFSINDMQMAINEIYARHGRRFQDEQIQTYFDGKSWYNGMIEPNNFDESMLSDIESENIDTLNYWMHPELTHSNPVSEDKFNYDVSASEYNDITGIYGSYMDDVGNSISIRESYGYNDKNIYYIGLADVSLIDGTAYTVHLTEPGGDGYYQLVSHGTKVPVCLYPGDGGFRAVYLYSSEADGWYTKQ